MKKLLALLMAMLMMVCVLSGCGEKAEAPADAEQSAPVAETPANDEAAITEAIEIAFGEQIIAGLETMNIAEMMDFGSIEGLSDDEKTKLGKKAESLVDTMLEATVYSVENIVIDGDNATADLVTEIPDIEAVFTEKFSEDMLSDAMASAENGTSMYAIFETFIEDVADAIMNAKKIESTQAVNCAKVDGVWAIA